MNDEKIREVLGRIAIPVATAVNRFEVRTGEDWSGDPAVWVFVVVNDDHLDELWPAWDQLREDIRRAVVDVTGPEPIVYVRMWSLAELEEQRRASP